MSGPSRTILSICDQLPLNRQEELIDFARFLLMREQAATDGESGDEAWERIINDPRPHPKLDAFLEESAKEPSEPMDLDRL